MAAQAIKQAVQQVASKGPRTVLELKLSCYDNRVVKMAERLKMAADMLNIKVYTLISVNIDHQHILDGWSRWSTHTNKAMDSIEVSVQIQEVPRVV
jgi:hypothetical protein